MRDSIQDWFEVVGPNLDRSILIDESDRQDEAQTTFLLNQGALHALHRTGFDANSFADHKVEIRLNPLPAEIRTQELDFGFRHREWPLTIANNPERTRRSKDGAPVSGADPHEHVRRKQRPNDVDTLSILPNVNALVGGQKRLNLPGIQMPDNRLLSLRHGV